MIHAVGLTSHKLVCSFIICGKKYMTNFPLCNVQPAVSVQLPPSSGQVLHHAYGAYETT